jgi:guanylate kinase
MSEGDIFSELAAQSSRGVLLVLTGPSGSGKDTVIGEISRIRPSSVKIITTTSRKMRVGEKEGEPYHFIPREEFEKQIAEDAFFEWVEFRGELYGTQNKTLTEAFASGKDVIWKIEAKGIKNTKEKIKRMMPRSVFVYLGAPDITTLKNRVFAAEGENASLRWNEALVLWELKQFDDCEYLVMNKDGELEKTVQTVIATVDAKRVETSGKSLIANAV